MTTLEHCDGEKMFIDFFCKRDLKEEDFLHFGKHLAQVDQSSFIPGEIFEKIKKQDPDQFLQIYDAAQVFKGRIKSMGYETDGQCEKNLERLWSLTFGDRGHSCLTKVSSKEALTFCLENLGNPDEVIALEDAGFSPAKAAALEKLLAGMTQPISISVRDPENLTEEEKEKISLRQRIGGVVIPWQTTSKDLVYSSYLAEHGDEQSLSQIPIKEKEKIIEKISTQLLADFQRQYHVAIITRSGLKRIYVELKENVGLEEEVRLSIRDAQLATRDLLRFVQGMANLTAREQLIMLDYSTQTVFNQAAALFYMSYLPKIQEFLSEIYPDEIFMPMFEGLSEIIHDVEQRLTVCTQLGSIGDLNLLGNREKAPTILQFKIEASFDWKAEEMVIDLVELVFADTHPFDQLDTRKLRPLGRG